MKRAFLALVAVATVVGCAKVAYSSEKNYTKYVDPLIGSGGHGHVFVGASVPFGGVQLGPVNISEGWDWCSGYHISDSSLIGYAHTHLSGTGIGDKGDILFMPYTGTLSGYRKQDYVSTFNRDNETAQAGYYVVTDNLYGVKAELTASERVGFHRYTYPADSVSKLLINLRQGIGWDKAVDCKIEKVSDTRIEGYRLSQGWAEDDRIYFVAEFFDPIVSFQYIDSAMVGLLTFGLDADHTLDIEVAISATSIEGARKNFEAEASDRNFTAAKAEADEKWNKLLSTIEITTADQAQLRTFYTSMFHAAIFPALFSDVDGTYRGSDGKIYKDDTHNTYTQFSLWDTYRAAHPLYTVLTPSRVTDFVNSFINIYEQQGKLPVWHLSGNETNCMTGISSVQVVGDAILKNIPGFDYQKAYEAMKAYAQLDERGLKDIRDKGFYPADSDVESVARALEYCISDYAVYKVAEKLGYADDAAYFKKRSQGYARYFDKNDGFMKGVMSDGTFRTPFDPSHSTHRADDFCEGNSWQYTWMVPHDFDGLFALFGSPEAAEAKLDLTYSTPYVPSGDASPDISGMIGQVAHGNEPSHATAYAYAAMGKYDKTAKIVRHILDSLYNDTPDGISGNEDMGEMSSWYILNSMGFYQPNPAGGEFVFGTPLFENVKVKLENGKVFEVVAENLTDDNIYIKEVYLNDVKLDKRSISYDQIMAGGQLKFLMGF